MTSGADGALEPARGAPSTRMWWLILAGLSSWSYMSVWSANRDELAGFFPGHFMGWLLLFLAIGAVVQRGTSMVLPSRSRVDGSFAVAAVVLVLLQAWNSRLTESLELGPRLAVNATLMLIVAAITLRLVRAFPWVRAALGVVTVFLVGVPYLTAVQEAWHWVTEPTSSSANGAVSTDALGTAADVFIVVLDEYTNGRVLRDQFGFDNSSFETALASSGVSIVDGALSNYTSTRLSVAGVLTGEYPAIGAPEDVSYADVLAIHAGDNRLFASAKEAGYETHLFDNAWTFTRCGANVDVCHRADFNELDWLVVQRTPFVDLIPWLQVSPWVRSSLAQFEEATALAGTPGPAPRLVYLHALVPHAPLQLTDDCSSVVPGLGSLEGVTDSPEARAAYALQVECVNRHVVDLVEAIPRNAVIFITGDHGVRWSGTNLTGADPDPAEVARTLGVLTAYRFPDTCEAIAPSEPLMRSVATLFSCLGIESEPQPGYAASQPSRYFRHALGPDGTYEITDVTSIVGADG